MGVDDLMERLSAELVAANKAGDNDLADVLRLASAELAGLRRDAERMNWMADNLVIEGFVSVGLDLYGYATDAAEESGRDEPIQDDVRSGIRRLLDAAMAAERGEV